MEYGSKWIDNAVAEISRLPGIGKKSALRATLFLLKQDSSFIYKLSEAIKNLHDNHKWCKVCHNAADEDLCRVCNSLNRDRSVVCVVEDLRDVLAIENTGQYFGLYHVLGGLIEPLKGIGPSQIKIQSLLERLAEGEIKEIILALSPNMEGDTTSYYLQKKLEGQEVLVTQISRGVPIGGDLEYADEVTLGRSIQLRTPAK